MDTMGTAASLVAHVDDPIPVEDGLSKPSISVRNDLVGDRSQSTPSVSTSTSEETTGSTHFEAIAPAAANRSTMAETDQDCSVNCVIKPSAKTSSALNADAVSVAKDHTYAAKEALGDLKVPVDFPRIESGVSSDAGKMPREEMAAVCRIEQAFSVSSEEFDKLEAEGGSQITISFARERRDSGMAGSDDGSAISSPSSKTYETLIEAKEASTQSGPELSSSLKRRNSQVQSSSQSKRPFILAGAEKREEQDFSAMLREASREDLETYFVSAISELSSTRQQLSNAKSRCADYERKAATSCKLAKALNHSWTEFYDVIAEFASRKQRPSVSDATSQTEDIILHNGESASSRRSLSAGSSTVPSLSPMIGETSSINSGPIIAANSALPLAGPSPMHEVIDLTEDEPTKPPAPIKLPAPNVTARVEDGTIILRWDMPRSFTSRTRFDIFHLKNDAFTKLTEVRDKSTPIEVKIKKKFPDRKIAFFVRAVLPDGTFGQFSEPCVV